MSLKAKQYLTDDAKALRVLACCGKAPNVLKSLDDGERTSVAALCDEAGQLADGGQEAFRLLMIEHYDRLKASDADLDEPTDVETPDVELDESPIPELSE